MSLDLSSPNSPSLHILTRRVDVQELMKKPSNLAQWMETIQHDLQITEDHNLQGQPTHYHLTIRDGWKPVWDLDASPKGPGIMALVTQAWSDPGQHPESQGRVIDSLAHPGQLATWGQSRLAVWAETWQPTPKPVSAATALQAALTQKYGQSAPIPHKEATPTKHQESTLEAGD